MNKIHKNYEDYEIFGDEVHIGILLDKIVKELVKLYNNKITIHIDSRLNYIRMKERYITNILKDILIEICKNSNENHMNIDISYRKETGMNIMILSEIIKHKTQLFINDLLIKFVMELHNGGYMINIDKNKLSILMTLPNYRVLKIANMH